MSTRFDDTSADTCPESEPVPDSLSWREAGWIFQDGNVLAIARRGDATTVRSTRPTDEGDG